MTYLLVTRRLFGLLLHTFETKTIQVRPSLSRFYMGDSGELLFGTKGQVEDGGKSQNDREHIYP